MNRQELIDSLPEWLRERADELLIADAFNLGSTYIDWFNTYEGYQFWQHCNMRAFDKAIRYLKSNNPEVYQKHYAKYFEETKTSRISNSEELAQLGVSFSKQMEDEVYTSPQLESAFDTAMKTLDKTRRALRAYQIGIENVAHLIPQDAKKILYEASVEASSILSEDI